MRWKWNRKQKKSEFASHVSEQERAEKLSELGLHLRQFRQQRSISLEHVATKTRISQRYLHAIEEGRLDRLPEPVYVQGFLRRFADALGLNGSEFANDFPMGPNMRAIKPSWRDLPAAQLRPVHLYLLYIFVIIGAVSGLSYVVSQSAQQTTFAPEGQTEQPQNSAPSPAPRTSDSAAKPQPTPADSAVAQDKPKQPEGNPSSTGILENSPVPSPDASATDLPGNKPVRIDVELSAQSWIRIVADGKTEFEGVLPEGSQRHWEANEKLVLRAGNAGGVLVTFNDSQTQQLGDPGTVEEVTFEADSSS